MNEMKMYAAISNTQVGVKFYLPPSVLGPLGLPPMDKLPDQSRDPDQSAGESWPLWPLFQIIPTWNPEAKTITLNRAWSNDEPDRKRLMRYHTKRTGWKNMRPFCLYAEAGTVMEFKGLPKCKSTHVPMTIAGNSVVLDCNVRLKPYAERNPGLVNARIKDPEAVVKRTLEQASIAFLEEATAWQEGGGIIRLDTGDGKTLDLDFNKLTLEAIPAPAKALKLGRRN